MGSARGAQNNCGRVTSAAPHATRCIEQLYKFSSSSRVFCAKLPPAKMSAKMSADDYNQPRALAGAGLIGAREWDKK
eukprot:COSAG01_NODE_615_length_14818_cov_9.454039_7_plen_77_part_00